MARPPTAWGERARTRALGKGPSIATRHQRALDWTLPVGRFAGTWLLMAVAMSLNGIARELVLKRVMPPPLAAVASALLGVLLIGAITWWGFRPLAEGAPSARELWVWSITLVVLTVAFETALGRFVDHKSWVELAGHYALWRGEWWPLVLLWLGATPFVWATGWLRA